MASFFQMVASKIPTLDLKFEVVMPFLQASTPYLANQGKIGVESTQLLFSLLITINIIIDSQF